MGVFADALARKYMLNNLKSFSRHDFFLGEQQLFRIHKSFARLLGSAKHLFKSSPQREIAFKRRCFYLDRSHPLKSYADLYKRYLQNKSTAEILVPQFLSETSVSQQRELFEAACQQ
jgi:hypothetical protein